MGANPFTGGNKADSGVKSGTTRLPQSTNLWAHQLLPQANLGLKSQAQAKGNALKFPDSLAPAELFETAKESIRRFPELVLAVCAVIVSLLVLSLVLARSAFMRAKELEATNGRLAAEVRERKMLEQKATNLNDDLEQRVAQLAILNQDLGTARDQALEGSRLKSEFVANISHEIRTPISAVIGANTLLLHTKLDDSQQEFAQLANDSAQSLLSIINDILDFSKMEAGKLEVNSLKFSLSTVLKEVVNTFAAPVKEKGLTMVSIMDPSLNERLIGDPVRLSPGAAQSCWKCD